MRTAATLLCLALLAAPGFGQMGDSRAKGLAGALTALGDDMNALHYNPAGLAFVRKGCFDIEGNFDIAFNRSLVDPFSNAIRDIYRSTYGDGSSSYYYSYVEGDEPNREFVFGVDDLPYLDKLTALAAADGLDYESQSVGVKEKYYRELKGMNALYNCAQSVVANPRLTVGGPRWGVSAFAEYSLVPLYAAGSTAAQTVLEYWVERRVGAVAGLGFALGPVAIGANAQYYRDALYGQGFDMAGDIDLGEFLLHEVDASLGECEEARFAVGLGALLRLGPLSLGVYDDNVTPFLDDASEGEPFIESLLGALNLGVALMPAGGGFQAGASPFVFLAAFDLKSVGDDEDRQLCAGLETGLSLGGFLEALIRCGYAQSLPGGLADLAFDPERGYLTLGATAKLWFLELDASYGIPVSSIEALSAYGAWTDAQRALDYMRLDLSASLSF